MLISIEFRGGNEKNTNFLKKQLLQKKFFRMIVRIDFRGGKEKVTIS